MNDPCCELADQAATPPPCPTNQRVGRPVDTLTIKPGIARYGSSRYCPPIVVRPPTLSVAGPSMD